MFSGSLTIGSYEYIGRSGTGTVSQSGGKHTVGSNLNLGYLSGSSGTYNLTGGTLDVNGDIFNWTGVFSGFR